MPRPPSWWAGPFVVPGRYRGMVPDRPLTEALLDVVREHLGERGQSVASLARATGTVQSTLSRQLRGAGVITVDEWDAIARVLGWMDLEELLETARHRL